MKQQPLRLLKQKDLVAIFTVVEPTFEVVVFTVVVLNIHNWLTVCGPEYILFTTKVIGYICECYSVHYFSICHKHGISFQDICWCLVGLTHPQTNPREKRSRQRAEETERQRGKRESREGREGNPHNTSANQAPVD